MRAFTAISFAASVAFSLFASAVPIAPVDGVVSNVLTGVPVDVPTTHGRNTDKPSIPVILTDLTAKLGPVTAELKFLNANNATTEVITPILADVVELVDEALTSVKNLLDQPLEVILESVDGTVVVAVAEVAQLLAGVITLVVSVLGQVLEIVGGDLSILGPILSQVGSIVAELVSTILAVVGGLLFELIPLVQTLVPTLSALVFNTLGGVLTLNL